MKTSRKTICRICNNQCGVIVEVEDGKVLHLEGDRDNPFSQGYTCLKGRALPEFLNHPKRLLRPLKRVADGSYIEIGATQALDEIAGKLARIIERNGPRAVANYTGTLAAYTTMHTLPVAEGFMKALNSPMSFSPMTIDQPGRVIARALHGLWMAPHQNGLDADAIMLVGINPLVTYIGLPGGHVPKWLTGAQARGMKLIVIDPRRTETARRAHLHLQPSPGHDTAIVAAIINVILAEGLHDAGFVAENAGGLDSLRAAVAPFTPEAVASRAKLPADQIVEAARIFAGARRGYALAGTGPNMSQPGTLLAYMLLNLDTLCGHLLREGERVPNPGTLFPAMQAKAQAMPPFPARGYGEHMRVRDFTMTPAGLPLSGLPDEILMEGPGQVRALIVCGGNPAVAWPDQLKTVAALESLECLVQIDPFMTQTGRYADYIVPPRMGPEVPATTQFQDLVLLFGHGPEQAYAQYAPAVAEPPAGSDLLDDWEVYYGLAQRLGLQIALPDPFQRLEPFPLDMKAKPTTDQVLEIACRQSRVPLDEVKSYPSGAFFPGRAVIVAPKDAGWEGRLDLANDEMMAELEPLGEHLQPRADETAEFDFRLISRRMMHVMNSCYNQPSLKGRRTYNPAYMNPADLARLRLASGEAVEIRSARASIFGVVEADDSVKEGVVSMSHCFGDTPARDGEVRTIGGNTSRLTDNAVDYDRYSGQPRMSCIPVRISKTNMVAAPAA